MLTKNHKSKVDYRIDHKFINIFKILIIKGYWVRTTCCSPGRDPLPDMMLMKGKHFSKYIQKLIPDKEFILYCDINEMD